MAEQLQVWAACTSQGCHAGHWKLESKLCSLIAVAEGLQMWAAYIQIHHKVAMQIIGLKKKRSSLRAGAEQLQLWAACTSQDQ